MHWTSSQRQEQREGVIARFVIGTCGQGLAVGDISTNRVEVINATAAFAWLQLELRACTTQEIAEHFMRTFGVSSSEAFSAVIGLLERWQ